MAKTETIQVTVPSRLYHLVQRRPVAYQLFSLTGVSVTFCPLLLYFFGARGVGMLDWRVITCLAIIYLVPGTFIRLGTPVMATTFQSNHSKNQSDRPT